MPCTCAGCDIEDHRGSALARASKGGGKRLDSSKAWRGGLSPAPLQVGSGVQGGWLVLGGTPGHLGLADATGLLLTPKGKPDRFLRSVGRRSRGGTPGASERSPGWMRMVCAPAAGSPCQTGSFGATGSGALLAPSLWREPDSSQRRPARSFPAVVAPRALFCTSGAGPGGSGVASLRRLQAQFLRAQTWSAIAPPGLL